MISKKQQQPQIQLASAGAFVILKNYIVFVNCTKRSDLFKCIFIEQLELYDYKITTIVKTPDLGLD